MSALARRSLFCLALLVLNWGVAGAADTLMMTAPASLYSGGRSAVTLISLEAASKKPASRSLRLELVRGNGAAMLLFSGETGTAGHRRFGFEVPRVSSGAYKLRAVFGDGQMLEVDTEVTTVPAFLIETDKPIYRPSQTIRGRVVRLNNDLRPEAGAVEVSLFDGKGIRVARQQLEADEYGAVSFELPLASEVNEGQWRIRARGEGVESDRDVRVERYVLPRFEVDVEFDKGYALVDESVFGTVEARYFYGKEVTGTARVAASRWVGTWQEYAVVEGALQDGQWRFQLPPVDFVAGTPQYGGLSAIRVDVQVTDGVGNAQSVVDSLAIAPAPVVLGVKSDARFAKAGLPLSLTTTAQTPDGRPASAQVELKAYFTGVDYQSSTETTTVQVDGSYDWIVVPPERTAFVDVEAQAIVAGRRASAAIRLSGSYSPLNSFLTIKRTDGDAPARLGQTLSFVALSSQPGTLYYEVYAGGRTVFSAFSETSSFSFPVTVNMLPSAKVAAYQITSDNEIVADSALFETQLDLEATVEAEFDSGEVKPGDSVQVTIDTKMKGRTMVGLSLVDQSVLSLGRSRLHLEEVFEELERRFLEPRAQVFQEPFGPGLGIPFFAPVAVYGAKDVFDGLGLRVAVSPDLRIPEGEELLIDAPINLSPPPFGFPERGQTAHPEMPRVRQFFPETWVWDPMLMTDAQGKATLTLTAPDSITGWRLAAVATQPNPTLGPGIAFGESDLIVFQEFFVEPSLPDSVVRGERIPIKIDVFNYLDVPQEVRLSLEAPEGFEAPTDSERSVSVPANGAAAVEFPIRPARVGEFPLVITAIGDSRSDAVRRELRVIPEGFEVEDLSNGVLRAGETAVLTPQPPKEAVEDSARAFLSITPSPVGQSIQGVSDLLMMPYGCGEQNMIFLAPDIEVLKYLREIGELNPEVRATAENFVNTGYQRQLTFRTTDGGFAAFGGDTGSLWLTAFVLSTFSGAREVRDIDENVLAAAAAMLVSRQQNDGAFEPDRFLIHSEMAGSVANRYTMAAYVANALADYGGPEVADALQKAAQFLALGKTTPEVFGNAYPLAIAAVALQKIPGFEGSAEAILNRLLELSVRDQAGLHWEPYAVETTGYALTALLLAQRPEAQPVLDWLPTQRTSQGGFGHSTQDTVVTLRALFLAARQVSRDLNLRVEVLGPKGVIGNLLLTRNNFDVLHQFELPADGSPVEIRTSGSGRFSYQLAIRYNLPGALLPPSSDLVFEVSYNADHVEVDDIVDVNVSMLFTGLKGRTSMVIADVSVPTGFESIQSSLDALIEKGVVERVDVAGRKRIFYIDHLTGGQELRFSFQIRALFPIRAEGVTSTAYEYYDASVRAFSFLDAPVIADPDAPPVIESVSETSATGGSRITIRGSGFRGGDVRVLFNGIASEQVEVLNDGTIVATVPNLTPGDVRIEVVTSNGSFVLEAGSHDGFSIAPFVLQLPIYANAASTGEFNGYAFSNYSNRAAEVRLAVRGLGENQSRLDPNPILIRIPSGEQIARLERELFDGADQLTESGWIEVVSDNAEVGAVFQFGVGRDALDGAAPFRESSQKFWFTRIHHGPGAYRGADAVTRLTLVNPHQSAVRLRLTLVERTRQTSQERTLEAGQSLTETINRLFSRSSVQQGAFVEVETQEGPGAFGFERIDLPSQASAMGLPAAAGEAASRFWSAQAAFSGNSFTTSVNLINTSGENRRIELLAVNDRGEPLSAPIILTLGPGRSFQQDMESIFLPGVVSGGAVSDFTGSLTVAADGPGVVGDVVFGDMSSLRTQAALPLQTALFRKAVFSHVADALDFFTGLAMYNPGAEAADVTVKVFRSNGQLTGEVSLRMEPGHRLSHEITQLVESAVGQIGGYIIVESTRPLVAQELFGSRSLRTLSAVPPTVVR